MRVLLASLFVSFSFSAFANTAFKCSDPNFSRALFRVEIADDDATSVEIYNAFEVKTENDDGSDRLVGEFLKGSYPLRLQRESAQINLKSNVTSMFSTMPNDVVGLALKMSLPSDVFRGHDFEVYAEINAMLADESLRQEWVQTFFCYED